MVAKVARSRGLRVKSPSYLWNWASDAVMAPYDLSSFHAVIGAVMELNKTGTSSEAEQYANLKWNHMEQVKAYHQRAGVTIRNALLAKVKELVAARHLVHTVESIELPGVAAGSMGLLRVAAVDVRPMQVPYSRLFNMTKSKAT